MSGVCKICRYRVLDLKTHTDFRHPTQGKLSLNLLASETYDVNCKFFAETLERQRGFGQLQAEQHQRKKEDDGLPNLAIHSPTDYQLNEEQTEEIQR